MSRNTIALLLSSFLLLLHPGVASAQADCGSLIQTDGVNTRDVAIEDCSDPFGPSTDENQVDFLINGAVIQDGDTIAIDFSDTVSYELRYATNTASIFGSLFKKVGVDYIADFSTFWLQRDSLLAGGVVDEPGEYTMVVSTEYLGEAPDDLILSRIRSILIPTAHAFIPEPKKTVISFVVTEAEIEEEPPLSDLLLQYEPILQFHEDENYFPMNVEAFVEGSGLWDSTRIDEVLIERVADPVTESNALTLDYLATTTDTENWYISFSSDAAGDFNTTTAKARYDNLVEADIAVPTYYAHESEHSYIDDLGNEHEFIVLQYWYFYAMNDWGEQGGFNNHEGDWESVFVFLDKETEEPEHVAFSSHHNDGDPSSNPTQYESVRRMWGEVQKDRNHVTSYVALGAHAMYSFQNDHRVPSINPQDEFFDRTSSNGRRIGVDDWEKRYPLTLNADKWVNEYEGKFGTDPFGDAFGSRSGIEGPLYNKVSGTNRFLEPLQWAGIDQITQTNIEEPEREFDFQKQGASFFFEELLPAGTEFSSSVFEEFISFGKNIREITLLPKFWQFEISLPNGSFRVETTLSYDTETLSALGISEALLGVYFYNEEADEWEQVPSSLNLDEQTISFFTDHFSIYTIGEVPVFKETDDREEGESVDSTESDTEDQVGEEPNNSSSKSSGTRVSRNTLEPEVLGQTTSSDEEKRRELMIEIINLLERKVELLTVQLIN